MRILTRPDFDGIVCAVLLKNVLSITQNIKWIQPNDIQEKKVNVLKNDIIANLPYNNKCHLWFDHHYSNKPKKSFNGSFKILPSAADVIYKYYKGQFSQNFNELVKQTNKIDSADLTLDEIIYPEKNPYILLSMTISGYNFNDEFYWNYLTDQLSLNSINHIMKKNIIKHKSKNVIQNNILYKKKLINHSYNFKHISITDFRTVKPKPNGNRFLVHSLFPQCSVNLKIFFEKNQAIVSASKNILQTGCLVNLGKMFLNFGGGGHDGAGGCNFPKKFTDKYLDQIINILLTNK